ncbi:alpha-ketoacid dehydrogenase subunit beta [Aliifodinibius sp. S!AR15-10]|uniref:alpha-ketoacid dehydrogenase subunit beta n=1 Tax=Aliifodinibius sp. S!AR15-10 TaxID=2950437 RepID=UPI002861D29C|nr:alpha-ketoacid dehydrogenase subunit beta [Aliifodinibius sp. S!AR15-10]MDR8393944.1 alpha-ketoacid dehydrogenase subunit beta [Aliifodinibius sp. S!AR15-10]
MKTTAQQTMTYRQAVRDAMREAMQKDDRVFLMGEDVGRYGGCFNVSEGMLEEFGEDRIIDTPLSESGFTGCGIGAAVEGMRPIVEIMTVNFSLLAADQIINTAAILQYMSGGQFNVPIVIRMATGRGKQLAAQHSRSMEGWYAHIPGLKILTPATVEDARGMLWPALEDPDPVLIFENSTLYNYEEAWSSNGVTVDIRSAKVRREGRDVSILTYGIGLHKSLEAAESLAEEGIEAEVVDLRVLRPLDDETILSSVVKTSRAVIVDEGWKSGGISAELSARIMEHCFYDLDCPVERVCGEEVPAPYAKHLEQATLPQPQNIVDTVNKMGGLHG